MKLVIQIPCKNEEKTLPGVIKDLPTKIPGVDTIEYMVIDDGSTDETIQVARDLGVHHILSFAQHRGLGYAFSEWMKHALYLGADVLVNTDGDNQYPGMYIEALIRPILDRKADMVIGNRNPSKVPFFSRNKQFLQLIGNTVVSGLVGNRVPDAVSGFRAYSRGILLQTHVTSQFSYVMDTLVQSFYKGFSIAWIDIHTHAPTRPSRLFQSIPAYLKKTSATLLRVYITYQSFKIFMSLTMVCALGVMGGVLFSLGSSWRWVMPIVMGILSILFFSLAVVLDVGSKNRMLLEKILTREQRESPQPSLYLLD